MAEVHVLSSSNRPTHIAAGIIMIFQLICSKYIEKVVAMRGFEGLVSIWEETSP
jgi:hypothetical protein